MHVYSYVCVQLNLYWVYIINRCICMYVCIKEFRIVAIATFNIIAIHCVYSCRTLRNSADSPKIKFLGQGTSYFLEDIEFAGINKLLEDSTQPVLLNRNVTLYQRANIDGKYFTSMHYKREKRQNNYTVLIGNSSSCYGLIENFISASTYQLVTVRKLSIKKGIPHQVEPGLITSASSEILFEDYITYSTDTQIYIFPHCIVEKCINLTVENLQLLTHRVNTIENE